MARIDLYRVKNEGNINAKASITSFSNNKSQVTQISMFIEDIGYITISRAEAIKLRKQLSALLDK